MTQQQQPQPQIFHALPLRDVVIFPQMTTTILVGREKSVNSIEDARRLGLPVLAVTQTNPDLDEFDEKNIHRTGTLCSIVEAIRTADGTFKVILQGLVRARIGKIISTEKFFTCEANIVLEQKTIADTNETLGLIKACIDNFAKYAAYNKRITPEILASVAKLRAPHEVIYMIATYVSGSLANKQKVLDEDDIAQKFFKLLEIIKSELEIGQAEERINKSVQEKFTKHQKEV